MQSSKEKYEITLSKVISFCLTHENDLIFYLTYDLISYGASYWEKKNITEKLQYKLLHLSKLEKQLQV